VKQDKAEPCLTVSLYMPSYLNILLFYYYLATWDELFCRNHICRSTTPWLRASEQEPKCLCIRCLALNAVPGDDHGAAQTVRLDLADSERLRSTDLTVRLRSNLSATLHVTVFFSHNKLVNNTFSHGLSAKWIARLLVATTSFPQHR
jgi:hypothetical protein